MAITFKRSSIHFLLLALFSSQFTAAQKNIFSIVSKNTKVTIVYDKHAAKLDSISAYLLSGDIEMVTGYKPDVITDVSKAKSNIIVIGSIQSNLVQKFIRQQSLVYKNLLNKWECFVFKTIDKPFGNVSKAFIIAGSDARGTAYGVFTLSEKMGVSPWYWWADVPVKKKNEIVITQDEYISSPPSVKYRGIFINDEDWGLQPWAAKTFETETGDIGPKTYSRVFELLLRLKANLIWPAMHPSTKAFFHYPGNVKTAEDYQIVIGSSHAEPMLRNNVDEWNEKTMGHFNYITNKEKVYQYWKDRVKESKNINAIYSIGMRGVHDSQMEGVKDSKEAVPLMERIFKDQRELLAKYVNKNVTAIPQVFTAYKEVLDIYDAGLKVPDDVTLVWPDDNYGYIQRLNTDEEKKRTGEAGVYYHASYWGRPHDYLWLPSTHPSLIREEMMKAYQTGADRLWVLNVGDIKPSEFNIQFFLDMAYNIKSFKNAAYSKRYMQNWAAQLFGKEKANAVTEILWSYYQLAFERRPEFMGWSQTEPTTKTNYTAYNHFSYGDEAQKRIDRYEKLEREVKALRKQFNAQNEAAFYQLVYYPVVSASWINKKFLYRDKAFIYGKQNRISAYNYAALSKEAYDSIVKETTWFNNQLSAGKWKYVMSSEPRSLPVYLLPELPKITIEKGIGWDAVPEGYDTTAYQKRAEKVLPKFTVGIDQKFFIDIFLSDSIDISWDAKSSAKWIRLSRTNGKLTALQSISSQRIWVTIDGQRFPKAEEADGIIEISAKGKTIAISVHAFQPVQFSSYKGFAESNGYVSIYAQHFSSIRNNKQAQWLLTEITGHTGNVLTSVTTSKPDTTNLQDHAAVVSYDFYSFSNTPPGLTVYTLPTHPLNKNFSMRYGVSIDDGPIQITDFRTFGRSEEWKQNVLSNTATRTFRFPVLKPGRHTLKIFAIDPGVMLDRAIIDFNKEQKNYSVLPETKKN